MIADFRHYIQIVTIQVLFLSAYALAQTHYNDDLSSSQMNTDEAMEYHFDALLDDPYVKQHFQWKLFFAQHPMYLLVDEDRGEPSVGERIPPWGAKTKEDYVERIRRNLKSLDELPELKLNYQWSALELEDLCRNFDDVYIWMQNLYRNGSLDFLDGTYSQAHLHVLTSESNWRQFEFGLEIYNSLFDKQVNIYSRQETGLHLQLPQLLKIFGYRFATVPAFTATVEITKGPFEFLIQEGSMETINGNGFIDYVGLDGSNIPFYLQVGLGWDQLVLEKEIQQDMYSGPRLFNVFPDLDEIDRDDFEKYYRIFDWVILGDVLEELYESNLNPAQGKVYSDWSYNEGVWAEELFRVMRGAEALALLAEQMNVMAFLNGSQHDYGDQIKDIWKTILKSQHHDISWIEVTDLKRKSINRLKTAIKQCRSLMSLLSSGIVDENKDSISVINGLPKSRNALVELNKDKSLDKNIFQNYRDRSFGFVSLPSGGYRSFKASNACKESKKASLPEEIITAFYNIHLSNEGLISQISAKSGTEILKPGDRLGGEIRARIDRVWYDNKKADLTYLKGEVFDIIERKTEINSIPLTEIYYFYKHQPYFKVELEFDFDGEEVGYMWFDETKLNVYYPTNGKQIHHDIPFGYVAAKPNRPLFPANWIECGGLVYVHRGTVKHRVMDGTIANVLAWGDNQFTNRLHWDWIEYTQYDIRLYGKQKIEYFIIPLGQDNGNRICRIVDDILSPVFITTGSGEKSFYRNEDDSRHVTSVFTKDNKIWKRGYHLPENIKTDWKIFNLPFEK